MKSINIKSLFLVTFSFVCIQHITAQYIGYTQETWQNQDAVEKAFLELQNTKAFKQHLKKFDRTPTCSRK